MSRVIEAIYENGVFKPLSKVDCPEHLKILVSIPSESDQVSPAERGGLDAIIDIAQDCSDTDLSIHHDKYLYGDYAA